MRTRENRSIVPGAGEVPARALVMAGYTGRVAMTPDARTLRTIGQLSTIGLAFVFAIMLGFAGGYWIDRGLGSSPWFSLLGFAVGLAAGILNVVRTMRAVSQPEPRPGDAPGPPSHNSP